MKTLRRLAKAFRGVLHKVVLFFQRLFAAIQHVQTGGASTRTRAQVRAARPARRCRECGQTMQHSPDYRDHLDEDDCQSHGWR